MLNRTGLYSEQTPAVLLPPAKKARGLTQTKGSGSGTGEVKITLVLLKGYISLKYL